MAEKEAGRRRAKAVEEKRARFVQERNHLFKVQAAALLERAAASSSPLPSPLPSPGLISNTSGQGAGAGVDPNGDVDDDFLVDGSVNV